MGCGASASSIDTLNDGSDWWECSKSPQQIKELEELIGLFLDDDGSDPPSIVDVHLTKPTIVSSRAIAASGSGGLGKKGAAFAADGSDPLSMVDALLNKPTIVSSRAIAASDSGGLDENEKYAPREIESIELNSAVVVERSTFDQDKKGAAAAAHLADDQMTLTALPDLGVEESNNETPTRLLEQIQEHLDELQSVMSEEELQEDNRHGLVVTTPPMKKDAGGSRACLTPQPYHYHSLPTTTTTTTTNLNSYSDYGSKEKHGVTLSPQSATYTDTTVTDDMSVYSSMSSNNNLPLEQSILPQLPSGDDEASIQDKQLLFQPSSGDEQALVTETSESFHDTDDNDSDHNAEDNNVVLGVPSVPFATPKRVSSDKKRKLLFKVGHLAKLMWKQLDERCKQLKKMIAVLRGEKKKLQEQLQSLRRDKEEQIGNLEKALQEAQEQRDEALLERDATLNAQEGDKNDLAASEKENESPRSGHEYFGENGAATSGMKTMSLEAYEQLQLDLFSKHKENAQLKSELESLKDELEEHKVKLAMASQPQESYLGIFSYFG